MIARFLLVLAFVWTSPVGAQALTAPETAAIDRLITAALADTGVPSASVAVVRGGRIVFVRAYGKQSERGGPADPRVSYAIASISKQFTAAALQLLAREGKLDLDDPVAKHLPGITAGDRITIRQLLSHTAGLRDYWPQDYAFPAMTRPVTPQGIVDRWARAPLDFAPGTRWQYSNTGYVVAGLIAEKAAGMPLLDYLQARIFRPLGIRAVAHDAAIGPGYAQGYKRFALGPVRPETPAAPGWLFAAGELAMSAEDLARWDVARLDRAGLPADLWEEQERPVRLTDGSSNGYGLGIGNSTREGRRTLEHSGEAVGFLAENVVFPEDRAAVVVLTNGWFSDAYARIASGIARVILPPATDADAAADAAAAARARTVYTQLTRGTLDKALLTENAASYFTPVATGDYRRSLGALGTPTAFAQAGRARLRGGFVNRVYRVSYPGRTLTISTYAEPAGQQRFEQFLVTPSQ